MRHCFALAAATRILAFVSLGAVSCTGTIDGSSGSPSASGSTPPDPSGRSDGKNGGSAPVVNRPDHGLAACKAIAPGPSPLRRLTRTEYDNTIRDLLGDPSRPARGFPAEEVVLGFSNNAEARSVSSLLAQSYSDAAEHLAKDAVTRLPTILACDPSRAGEPACLGQFLDGFARRAWRRAREPEAGTALTQVFTAGRTATFADGIEAVMEVLLLSPQFLYRLEEGVAVPGASYAQLRPMEMASRLSYLLWGSMPDEQLFTDAAAGKLETTEGIAAEARRMLADPRAVGVVRGFIGDWLSLDDLDDLDKDTSVYPSWKPELRPLLRTETERFFDEVIWHEDGKLATLLTAPFTFANGPLAQYYGLPAVTGDFQKVAVDPKQRAGFLTQGSLLADNAAENQSSPVARGKFVREQIFCEQLPPPPPAVMAQTPAIDPKLTTAERFARHRTDPSCSSCHQLIDPLGLGFENFDGAGLWRTTENGKPIDAHGEVVGTDIAGTFNGAVELAQKVAGSTQVQACLTTEWFRYGFGREATSADACSTGLLAQSFAGSGGNVRELLLALTQTDAFLYLGKGTQP
jgi:hypothetical protein